MYERETWATTRYLCPDRCILYMGSLWEPEDPLHLSYDKCSVTVSFTLQHGNGTMLEILWPHHTQCSWWRPSACSCCCVLRFASLHQTGNEAPVRPNHTWLRAIELDLRPLNIGPSCAWKKAASQEHWRSIVDMATLKKSMSRRERREVLLPACSCWWHLD